MQNEHIKLNEIIWEITGQCKNNCSYCGSKNQWDEPICEDKIKSIVDAIIESEIKPKCIDISGGDPLLVDVETHRYIVNKLKSAKISPKILCNVKSLKNNFDNVLKIIGLYDWIGVSINTSEDIELFKGLSWSAFTGASYTIISNFNLENIFIFDDIRNLASSYNKPWQIQYTVYEEENNPLALYNNESARNKFFELIHDCLNDNKINLVISDNLNDSKCGAGISVIGLLSDGTIVPCLSMRSWNKNIKDVSQGNILKEGLTNIWKNKFVDYRFSTFKCCKDHCKNKCFERNIKTNVHTTLKEPNWWEEKPTEQTPVPEKIEIPYIPPPPFPCDPYYPNQRPQICMYAVFMPNDSNPYNPITTSTHSEGTDYVFVKDSKCKKSE